MADSYEPFSISGLGIDPIHVGTGGARLGRVDLSIVRDPVTRVPKIPGSSLAGVCRAYAAMANDRYPACAGLGMPDRAGKGGHCGQADCPICTVFGFARGDRGGFAGLAAFSDAHVLLFPVATRDGPRWITCPTSLRAAAIDIAPLSLDDALYGKDASQPLNLGWILLPVKQFAAWQAMHGALRALAVPEYVLARTGVLSDKLFTHVVNSNLEVRTSVSIAPETGAAEDKALFTYEALPRSTILLWQVTCRNPRNFKVAGSDVKAKIGLLDVDTPARVFEVVKSAHPYLEHLGIGGMGTRGMGRLRVLAPTAAVAAAAKEAEGS